jgi:N6-L-threonylcarbamoyladenine synthase
MYVLGIETSCDETAAAVVENGNTIRSSVVASQVAHHRRYGGVVPELASRMHMQAIVPVVRQAIEQGGVPVDAVAVTQGPGLVGALLVGFAFSKAYAYGRRLPVVGVDHLEGHLQSVSLGQGLPPFPLAALLASGGHTGIYYMAAQDRYELLGQTRDDAAGEAYDKVAKMLGLGYPGGAAIDRLAGGGDPHKLKFTRPYLDKQGFDFSFSGIKTAVQRYVQSRPMPAPADIAAGFQEAVVDVLVYKLLHAAQFKKCRHIAVVGGVAANARLRERVSAEAAARGLRVYIPSLALCGDNAAMIAALGYHRLQSGHTLALDADVYSRAPRTFHLSAEKTKNGS